MEGGEDVGGVRALHEFAARHGDAEVRSKERLGGGRAEADDDFGMDGGDLPLQPLVAGVDLALRRSLVQPAFAAELPFEVLYRVGYVQLSAIDARRLERPVE